MLNAFVPAIRNLTNRKNPYTNITANAIKSKIYSSIGINIAKLNPEPLIPIKLVPP